MDTTDNDAELLARVARQDRSAISVLFARHHVRVFRFITRITGNEAVAEELTNEVFVEVWKNAHRFEGRSAVSTWLLSIARNRAISAMRKRSESALDEEQAANIADLDDTPEVVAQKQDKGAIIRRCMDGLSAEHREVIDLVYYHEKSVAEVSEIVGIPANTVKTRMFHARKKLSELLKSAGVDRGWP